MRSIINLINPNFDPLSTQRRQARPTIDAGLGASIECHGEALLAAVAPALDEHMVAQRFIRNLRKIDAALSDADRVDGALRRAGAGVAAPPATGLPA